MADSLTFIAEGGTQIPSYLLNSPDASFHVFEFLSDPSFGQGFSGHGTSGGSVLNWTDYCSQYGNAVLGYGPFVGCLLYPNVTRNVRDGILPANLTGVGFSLPNNTADELSRQLQSWIPTCLVSYCASQPDCISTFNCDVGNLFTDGRDLSAQGVATCWQTLCSLNVQALDADIAGIGILISYLIQSIIAMLGLTILTMLAGLVFFYNRKALAAPDGSEAEKRYSLGLARARRHWEIVTVVFSDFHRAQCYLAIALQIGAYVIIFTDLDSTSYNDQNFLLLVAMDGLVPIVLSLYTLMAFGKKSWYMITLSIITVILASVQGGYITHHVLLPQGDPNRTTTIVNGGHWPAVCGNIGPTGICAGIGPNAVGFDNAAGAFDAVMATLVAITALLLLWKIFNNSPHIWSMLSSWLATMFTGQDKNGSHHNRNLQHITRAARVIFHTIITVGCLGCLFVELYYFNAVFTGPFVNFQDWSFGQIVGITTWAGVFADFAYLECFGVDGGSNWRFPRWVHIRDDSQAAAPAAAPPSTIQLADNGKTDLGPSPHMPDSVRWLTATGTELTMIDVPIQPYQKTLSFERHVSGSPKGSR